MEQKQKIIIIAEEKLITITEIKKIQVLLQFKIHKADKIDHTVRVRVAFIGVNGIQKIILNMMNVINISRKSLIYKINIIKLLGK